jgi:AmiR/NasT family two-component response regulator
MALPLTNGVIRIVLVEDHGIVRDGLASLIQRERDFQLVGEAVDGLQAVDLVDRLRPAVVLVDVDMPKMDGRGDPPHQAETPGNPCRGTFGSTPALLWLEHVVAGFRPLFV